MDAHYDVTYFWLFVEFFACAKVVGATSSEGFLVEIIARMWPVTYRSQTNRRQRASCGVAWSETPDEMNLCSARIPETELSLVGESVRRLRNYRVVPNYNETVQLTSQRLYS